VPRTEIRLTTSRLILSLLVEEGREDAATVKEIRRHASKIAFAYNKGARQYLRDAKRRLAPTFSFTAFLPTLNLTPRHFPCIN
jgi:hypothetical protein